MKVVVLCGGLGTRLAEETHLRPKPMVEVGGKPVLWHILNTYAAHGFCDFSLALGYMGSYIKNYFLNYHALESDFSVDFSNGNVEVLRRAKMDWKIDLIDTGAKTLTGGRVHRLESMLAPTGTFMLTYGDGLSNVDIKELLKFHRSHGKIATVTAVRPPARFGEIRIEGNAVREFKEKPQIGEGWINGGYFVFEPEIFKYLNGDETVLEGEPLERLAKDGQLQSFKHSGFWQCMDTIRDKNLLETLWASGDAPWKIW
jgi:glucose-1-phosphate cytidylyltransferase